MPTLSSLPGTGPTINMGLGALGGGSLVYKRKFRWTMSISYCAGAKVVPQEFVKVGARPQLDIEETEINYLHGKTWIPGKAAWQTMALTYYDMAGTPASPLAGGATINNIFGWLASIYDITNSVSLYMGSHLQDYEGQGQLYLYDGCGQAVEGWLLNHMWPQSVNFGELDMSSSEEVTVEMTMRYSEVQYVTYCPTGTVEKCPCVPCS